MVDYIYFFKCRWCGAIFSTKSIQNYFVPPHPDGVITIEHECVVGRKGIADYIGYRQKHEHEKRG